MRIIDLSQEKTIINQFVTELRDVDIQKDRLRFHTNIARIAHAMAYEISRTLDYEDKAVMTSFGVAHHKCPSDELVLATILRAGIPFHRGFLDIFDNADNAFISAYRKYAPDGSFEVHTEYLASPRLDGKTVIIVDPMLATGLSLELALKSLLTKGTPRRIIVAAVIAARPAFEHLRTFLSKDTDVFCAAVDEELNEHFYIVPGLGDAGDLLFGEKE
ncbi:MAG: uracil phosphoribosyltransferase [Prevotella sp.]|nr:uracil phosphoribosyltransferase [Candidatus Equicola faecalis]